MGENAGNPMTTGLAGLDSALKGILPGDNIVWQIDSVEDYSAFVKPYCEAARANCRRLIYFRFASHKPLLPADFGAEIHELKPENGFENFIAEIHGTIEAAGRGAFYVFDCLSELAVDWYSDQMLGNFFMLTCPYLFDLETVTYFALYRNYHSSDATGPISETTQLFLDVYRHKGKLFVYPVKVQHRYSPTMHMLHVWEGDDAFRPVGSSAIASEILGPVRWSHVASRRSPGSWEHAFLRAGELVETDASRRDMKSADKQELFDNVARMVISRDENMLKLVSKYMTIGDVIEVRKRMVGSGLIGGKTVGMLLARAILRKAGGRLGGLLETHDSFYIGSDVFYTFLVRNGIWWVRQKQRDPSKFLEGAEQARQRMLTGSFPEYTMRQIEEMLDYFGQSPIIVRSSSLLEDNFGNTFAGKYESVFCGNQGPRERRIQDLLAAIRTVYASTMSEKALSYRARRGILDRDEQMAVLVMRVSGAMYGRYFYPPVAGVGFSFNPYVWNENIDPKAGVVRLVFGLGTRAVNRSDDDYTRIVALNAPERRPEANFEEVRQYAQRKVDYIDLDANQLVAGNFHDVAAHDGHPPLDLLAEEDSSARERGIPRARVLTFGNLLSNTAYVDDMRQVLAVLQKAYGSPVDIEFTTNFLDDGDYRINLVQCRPLPVQGGQKGRLPAIRAGEADRIIEARGAVIGHSRLVRVSRFVYVSPEVYGQLPVNDRYAVAGVIGRVNRASQGTAGNIMLLGPGRWGTSSPSLGVPVSFQDINRVSILCEIVAMREDLIPDVSLGTHFLNELVEMDMLYVALFPDQKGNRLRSDFFIDSPNQLLKLVPDAKKWKDAVKVIDIGRIPVALRADAMEQRVVCYFDR